MSPDSASCSTRAGSGVCGGGSRSPFSPAAAGGAGAGRGVGVDVGTRRPCASSGGRSRDPRAPASRRPGRRSSVRRPRRRCIEPTRRRGAAALERLRLLARRAWPPPRRSVTAEQPVAGAAQPGGDLVDRRPVMTRTPKTASSTQQRDDDAACCAAGPSAARRRRSRCAPPASWSAVGVAMPGSGMPLAMWTRPSTPKSSAAQPITWRPAGPLRSGLRRVRQRDEARAAAARTSRAARPSR